jgi:cystathionine beta-lyase
VHTAQSDPNGSRLGVNASSAAWKYGSAAAPATSARGRLRCALAHFTSEGAGRPLRARASEPRARRIGILSQHATVAAWREGKGWLAEVRAVLDTCRQQLIEQLPRQLPEAKVYLPDATYLAWLDLRALELGPSPAEYFRQKARVALSDGAYFGQGYESYARINFATSGALLGESIERMVAAVRARIEYSEGRCRGLS